MLCQIYFIHRNERICNAVTYKWHQIHQKKLKEKNTEMTTFFMLKVHHAGVLDLTLDK